MSFMVRGFFCSAILSLLTPSSEILQPVCEKTNPIHSTPFDGSVTLLHERSLPIFFRADKISCVFFSGLIVIMVLTEICLWVNETSTEVVEVRTYARTYQDHRNSCWVRRTRCLMKTNKTLSRLCMVSPMDVSKYALRLLLLDFKGPTCEEDLRRAQDPFISSLPLLDP